MTSLPLFHNNDILSIKNQQFAHFCQTNHIEQHKNKQLMCSGDKHMKQWQIWIDRGGTFTDIVGKRPDGTLVTHKLLSENPEKYQDAAVQGIRDLLQLQKDEIIPPEPSTQSRWGQPLPQMPYWREKATEPFLLLPGGSEMLCESATRPGLTFLHAI